MFTTLSVQLCGSSDHAAKSFRQSGRSRRPREGEARFVDDWARLPQMSLSTALFVLCLSRWVSLPTKRGGFYHSADKAAGITLLSSLTRAAAAGNGYQIPVVLDPHWMPPWPGKEEKLPNVNLTVRSDGAVDLREFERVLHSVGIHAKMRIFGKQLLTITGGRSEDSRRRRFVAVFLVPRLLLWLLPPSRLEARIAARLFDHVQPEDRKRLSVACDNVRLIGYPVEQTTLRLRVGQAGGCSNDVRSDSVELQLRHRRSACGWPFATQHGRRVQGQHQRRSSRARGNSVVVMWWGGDCDRLFSGDPRRLRRRCPSLRESRHAGVATRVRTNGASPTFMSTRCSDVLRLPHHTSCLAELHVSLSHDCLSFWPWGRRLSSWVTCENRNDQTAMRCVWNDMCRARVHHVSTPM